MSKWEKMDGAGEAVVAGIVNDVREWGKFVRLRAMAEQIKANRSTYKPSPEKVLDTFIDSLVSPDTTDIAEIVEQLPEEFVQPVIVRRAEDIFLRYIEGKARGTSYGHDGRRMRVAITHPGVLVSKMHGIMRPNGYPFYEDQIGHSAQTADPGHVFEGGYGDVVTLPEFGGMAIVRHHFGSSVLSGLVNTETLVPRVSLDILGKR